MKWFGLFVLNSVCIVVVWLLVALSLPFAKKDPKNIYPSWLQWLNTPDDPGCDQGLYEDQVLFVQDHLGWYVKTWYWLGIRNQALGLFSSFLDTYDGAPVTEYYWWKFKIYKVWGHKEITWPGRRVSFGYKVQTLKTAKLGDPIWWVCQPSFWKSREY